MGEIFIMVNHYEIEHIVQESVEKIEGKLDKQEKYLAQIKSNIGAIGYLEGISRDIGDISLNMKLRPTTVYDIDSVYREVKEIQKHTINLGYLERLNEQNQNEQNQSAKFYDALFRDLQIIKILLGLLIILFALVLLRVW